MITIAEATKRLGLARSTVLSMVQRQEITGKLVDGMWLLDEDSVAAAPRRGRGHPALPSDRLRGAAFTRDLASGRTKSEIAKIYGVSRQDVDQAVDRYARTKRKEKRASSMPSRAK